MGLSGTKDASKKTRKKRASKKKATKGGAFNPSKKSAKGLKSASKLSKAVHDEDGVDSQLDSVVEEAYNNAAKAAVATATQAVEQSGEININIETEVETVETAPLTK